MARSRFGIYVCMYITGVNAYPLLEATLKCQNKCGCKKKGEKISSFFFFFFFFPLLQNEQSLPQDFSTAKITLMPNSCI